MAARYHRNRMALAEGLNPSNFPSYRPVDSETRRHPCPGCSVNWLSSTWRQCGTTARYRLLDVQRGCRERCRHRHLSGRHHPLAGTTLMGETVRTPTRVLPTPQAQVVLDREVDRRNNNEKLKNERLLTSTITLVVCELPQRDRRSPVSMITAQPSSKTWRPRNSLAPGSITPVKV